LGLGVVGGGVVEGGALELQFGEGAGRFLSRLDVGLLLFVLLRLL
jgi:hypothetical protein